MLKPYDLDRKQRDLLADGLKSLANLVIGSLCLNYFINPEKFEWYIPCLGGIFAVVFYKLAVELVRKEEE